MYIYKYLKLYFTLQFFKVIIIKLKPVAMDETITQFLLDLEGQQLSYDHGPSRPVATCWPAAAW